MSKIFGVVQGILLIIFSGILIKDVFCPAFPTKVEIPKFKGEILQAQEIKHQVFSIQKDFAEVAEWGEESILTYEINKSNGLRYYEKVKFEAWRPDPQRSNIMQTASKS